MELRPNIVIGNTPLHLASTLSQAIGKGNIFLKLESYNPSGSHKDRMAAKIAEKALVSRKSGISVGSCGSYGLSIAYTCRHLGINCQIFIPKSYKNDKIQKIRSITDCISFIDGTYEDAIRESHEFCTKHDFLDGNATGPNLELCKRSYYSLADEIMQETQNQANSIWLPIGNGTTFLGLFESFGLLGYTPTFGLVGSRKNSAVISSLQAGRPRTLPPGSIVETQYNEPLVSCLPPPNMDQLLSISRDNSVYSFAYTDTQLVQASELLLACEGIQSPSYACAGLAGLIHHNPMVSISGPHLVVLTS